jgi:dienelactone hydrolase
VAASASELEKKEGAAPGRATIDLQHIVPYLQQNAARFRALGGGESGNAKAAVAALQDVKSPDALLADTRRALEQAEAMMKNVHAGKDAYAGLSGDLRRALRSAADGNLAPYRVFIPDAYAKAEKVPFVYLVGGSEDTWPGLDGGKAIEIVNKRGYMAATPRWDGHNRPWSDVPQVLAAILKDYPKIDPDRVYCTGSSAGGFGTYQLATEQPETFAAICCASGTGDPNKAERLKSVPMLILQGGADDVVLPAGAERMAARLKELGYVYDFRLNPKYGHNYHTEEYMNLTLDFFDKYKRRK